MTRRRLDWPNTSFREEYFDFARVSAAAIIENTVELLDVDEAAGVVRALEQTFSHPKAPAHVRLAVAAAHQAVTNWQSRPRTVASPNAAVDDEVFYDALDNADEKAELLDVHGQSDGGSDGSAQDMPYQPLGDEV